MSLPLTVDPLKFADQGIELSGSIALEKLPRISALLVSTEGQVEAELVFGRDEQNIRTLSGKLVCDLTMTCQRCLEPVVKTIQDEFVLGIVLNDEYAKNLPKGYEPLIVVPDDMELAEILDEELLLSVPMYAYHDRKNCKIDTAVANSNGDGGQDETKPNPFGVLSKIKFDK